MEGSDQKQSTLPKYTFLCHICIYDQLEETCLKYEVQTLRN